MVPVIRAKDHIKPSEATQLADQMEQIEVVLDGLVGMVNKIMIKLERLEGEDEDE